MFERLKYIYDQLTREVMVEDKIKPASPVVRLVNRIIELENL